MTRITETIPVSYNHERIIGVKCDLCGKEFRGNRWGSTSFEILETAVHMKEGEQYPECGNSTEIRFDVCPECFKSKLIPWFLEQGAFPTETESEW